MNRRFPHQTPTFEVAARAIVLALVAFLASACLEPPDPEPLWAEHCGSCHGARGHGDSRRVRDLPALDLHRSEMVEKRLNGRIYSAIRDGLPAMPAFGHKLSHEEMDSLTAYVLDIRSLGPPPGRERAPQPPTAVDPTSGTDSPPDRTRNIEADRPDLAPTEGDSP